MMTLADHLLATRTPEQMARELATLAKQNAALRDRVDALEHELFWMKAVEAVRSERTPEWYREQYLTTPPRSE